MPVPTIILFFIIIVVVVKISIASSEKTEADHSVLGEPGWNSDRSSD